MKRLVNRAYASTVVRIARSRDGKNHSVKFIGGKPTRKGG